MYGEPVHVQECKPSGLNYSLALPLSEEMIIGEQERANLVVELARFFYIHICFYPALSHTIILYVLLNKRLMKFHTWCVCIIQSLLLSTT